MGKDGSGYGSENTSYTVTSSTPDPEVIKLHLEVLKMMGTEMERLYDLIKEESGDVDASQEMLSTLHNELCRLSEKLSETYE